MSVVTRKRLHKTVYYVVVTWRGKRIWEHAGTDKRDALRLDKRRLQEVKDGTYLPKAQRGSTVGRYLTSWIAKRKGRNEAEDIRILKLHVLHRTWFMTMRLESVRNPHIRQLAEELKATVSEATGKPLSPKYVANIFGLVRTMFNDAHAEELIDRDPCKMPRGYIARRSGKGRKPYPLKDLQSILTCQEVPLQARMFAGLAFFTGGREGEICGLRFRDWDRAAEPLGCLTIERQYDDRPLKTDKEGEPRPRKVPVHPKLAAALEAWWSGGFELVYLRKPTEDDFIVPRVDGDQLLNHTRSSAYKLWRRAIEMAGVTNLSLHSTRHTFISLARRNSLKEKVEVITHNAKGDVIDQYTHREWEELCEVVLLMPIVDAIVDGNQRTLAGVVEAQGIEPGGREGNGGNLLSSGASEDSEDPPPIPRDSVDAPPIVARVNARLDSDRTAKPLSEIPAVAPVDEWGYAGPTTTPVEYRNESQRIALAHETSAQRTGGTSQASVDAGGSYVSSEPASEVTATDATAPQRGQDCGSFLWAPRAAPYVAGLLGVAP